MRIIFLITCLTIGVHFNVLGQRIEKITSHSAEIPNLVSCLEPSNRFQTMGECTEFTIIHSILSHFKYPNIARENGNEGTILFQWTVDENGLITDTEVLHSFTKDGERFIKKMLKKSDFKSLLFEPIAKTVKLQVVINCTLEGNDAPYLLSFEQLFCARGEAFKTQSIRKRRLLKYLSKTTDFQDYWRYKHLPTTLKAVKIARLSGGEMVDELRMESLDKTALSTLLGKVKKRDLLTFEIQETVESEGEIFDNIYTKHLLIE